jgi:hypothetical protein
LIAAGTSAATFGSALELAAGVDVEPELEDDPALDEVVELELLLLPQPAITAALISATSTADVPVHLFMAFLF